MKTLRVFVDIPCDAHNSVRCLNIKHTSDMYTADCFGSLSLDPFHVLYEVYAADPSLIGECFDAYARNGKWVTSSEL